MKQIRVSYFVGPSVKVVYMDAESDADALISVIQEMPEELKKRASGFSTEEVVWRAH